MLPFLLNLGLIQLEKEQVHLVFPGYWANSGRTCGRTCSVTPSVHKVITEEGSPDLQIVPEPSGPPVVAWLSCPDRPSSWCTEAEQGITHSLDGGTWRSWE